MHSPYFTRLIGLLSYLFLVQLSLLNENLRAWRRVASFWLSTLSAATGRGTEQQKKLSLSRSMLSEQPCSASKPCGQANAGWLEQVGGELCEPGALSFGQRDMAAQVLLLEALNNVGQAVADRIQIRMVNLTRVAHQDDLAALARP